jgi:hypothetical protein
MKRLLFIGLVFSSLFASGQQFHNEWVNYSQPYFKFDIKNEGVYRISYQVLNDALAANGFNLSTIDKRNFQVFARGEEQHIYVPATFNDPTNFTFGLNDYIEFYARGNDGEFDTPMYDLPNNHGNPYYSHFNDTISYFLTWNSSTANARMTLESDVTFTGYTPSPYIIRDEVDELHDQYFLGQGYVQVAGSTSPEYTGGEGWYGYYFDGGFTDTFWNLNTSFRTASGPDAEIEISVVGHTNDNKNLRITGPGILFDTVMVGYNGYRYNFTVPTSSLGANTTNFTFDITNTPAFASYQAIVGFVKVRYPMTPNLGGVTTAKFFVPNNPNYPAQPKSYVQLAGYNESTPRVYDLTNHKRISVSGTQGSFGFLIPDNGTLKECFITGETAINANAINSLIPAGANGSVYFTDLTALNPATDYFAISNASMYAEAQSYASYRNTTGHTAIALDVDELYSQFAWGIRKHPLAIRNFANWTLSNLDAPKHIFLIGKSIASRDARTDPANYAMVQVPSYGYPPSDMMFTSRLGNTYLEEPALAVGRLAAQTAAQVSDYQSKMQEYEALDPALWMKRILHFSGGGIQSEVTQIRSYLDSYKYIIEDTLYGADVITFQKTSSEPFQITQVDSIRQLIEQGVQMTNFFGHGSGVGFDVSIDHPSQFQNNSGKYPFMVANSCYAGDIHQPTTGPLSLSEEWVLYPRGAMAFMSTVGPGNKFYLHNYCTRFVKNISYGTYGESIGMAMKKTVRDNAQPNNPVTRIHNLEYTLHGDPAFNITDRPLPDLMVNQQSLYTEMEEVTTEQDSFALNIIITNLGRAFSDSFIVDISRVLPAGGAPDFNASIIHHPVDYIDTMTVMVPVDFLNGIGLNNICVTLDATDTITEIDEMNNAACLSVNVISPDIIPVYPYEFAVMPDQGITLKASTGNPFAQEKTYRLEVDTTDLFNSPIRQFTTVTQGGGVVTWTPSLLANMPDSTVYFWRASVDSATYGFYKWRESSFQYIVDKYGWGQAHFFQYKKDDFSTIFYNRPNRTFDFLQALKQLSVNNFGAPTTLSEAEAINFFVDNGREEYVACPGPSVYSPQLVVAVIDPCSLVPWQTPGNEPVTGIFLPGNGNHGQLTNCSPNRPRKWYTFRTGVPSDMDAFANFVNNVVPDSHHIAILSWLGVDFTAMQPQHLQVFTDLGATQVGTLSNVPYIFYTRKGDNATTMEVAGTDISDHINYTVDMVGCFGNGQITTPVIGPSTEWRSLHLRANAMENPNLDSIAVNVIGIRPNGQQEVVIPGIQGWSQDIIDLANQIDADEFPRLKLNAYLLDDSLVSTPPQLDRWQVLFDGVPEAALNPHIQYAFVGDTLTQGEMMMFTTAIENIGDYDMDSLLVHYWIEDASGVRHDIPYARQAPFLVGDILIDTIYTNPVDLEGGNRFWVEVNPNGDQLEQYHFNNIGSIQFNVEGDKINPLLDVTFDGVHILDGDIVSANPMIVMEVKDESQIKLLNDTADMQVFLKEPGIETLKRIWFSNNTIMQFYPGEAPDNKARIEWNPELAVDGMYELWVQAYDKSNNASGDAYHRISFEVVNKPSITNVLNYPNPFSTRTQFVFTMTGSEQPTYFKIQILTITGKVVKEITSDEIGPMNIGRNVTDYYWDGKDRFGDQLGNGVYLYRVVAKLNGQTMELRESGADQWIESGFGKMMLIR